MIFGAPSFLGIKLVDVVVVVLYSMIMFILGRMYEKKSRKIEVR